MTYDCNDIPAPPSSPVYNPNAINLYGVKLNTAQNYARIFAGDNQQVQVQLVNMDVVVPSGGYSVAAAHGYSYDGHCYRFDSVRVFVIIGALDDDPVGCGFDISTPARSSTVAPLAPAAPNPSPPPPTWRMWRLTTASKLVELTTAYNDAQTLILDAALPGKRAPNTYAIAQALAHRGGQFARE